MYLVILGGSINKSDEERRMEDEEEINYLNQNKKSRRNSKWKKNC